MACFQLLPKSLSNGDFAAAFFDDDPRLWDDSRLRSTTRLGSGWEAPDLALLRPERGATSVLFNPNAIAVSQGVRDELAAFEELEFLPVTLHNHGVFFILHVVAAVDLPVGAQVKVAPAPSGNLLRVEAFPDAFDPPASFFRLLNPNGSSARRAGSAARQIYLSATGAECIRDCAGAFLEARPIPAV